MDRTEFSEADFEAALYRVERHLREHGVYYMNEGDGDAAIIAALRLAASKPPLPDGETAKPQETTYYTEGKDALWFEGLDDAEFAQRASAAAMDIVDGDFSAIERYIPVVAILSNAATRIERLLSSPPSSASPKAETAPSGKDETAWLVERPQTADRWADWWHPEHGWTRDPNRALRLARKEDAAAYIKSYRFTGDVVPSEHKWMAPLASAPTHPPALASSGGAPNCNLCQPGNCDGQCAPWPDDHCPSDPAGPGYPGGDDKARAAGYFGSASSGGKEERERIVKFLRERDLDEAANSIERGLHEPHDMPANNGGGSPAAAHLPPEEDSHGE